MNDLQIFEHPEFGSIRTIEKNGEPWFVAADVCRVLDIQNPTQAIGRLDEDERAMFNIGRQGETWCINEPGLYSLVLGSRKPEAKAFKRWITHEVIPSIRHTGTYSLAPIVERRYLTADDYLRAAAITANCRNERLPYVLGFLEQAGFSIPEIKQAYNLPEPENWEEAYRYVCGWVSANAEHFGRIGKMVGEYAVIPRPVFNQICEDAGFMHKSVLKSMKDYGILLTSGKGFTRTARIAKRDGVSCVWMKIVPEGNKANE